MDTVASETGPVQKKRCTPGRCGACEQKADRHAEQTIPRLEDNLAHFECSSKTLAQQLAHRSIERYFVDMPIITITAYMRQQVPCIPHYLYLTTEAF